MCMYALHVLHFGVITGAWLAAKCSNWHLRCHMTNNIVGQHTAGSVNVQAAHVSAVM